MTPLLLHGNTNQYNINGLLSAYTEMFRILTCCNYILSAAEGFRGQEATCADPGMLSVLFSPQLILQFTEGIQWFYCRENYTYTYQGSRGIHYFPGGGGVSNFFQGGGGPNANFFINACTYLLFSRGGVRNSYAPLDPRMGNAIITGQFLSQSRF